MDARDHIILFDARAAVAERPGVNRYIRSLLTALVPALAADERLHVIVSPESEDLPCLTHVQVTRHVAAAAFGTLASHYQAFKVGRAVRAEVRHAPYILTPIGGPGKLVLTIHDVIPLSHPQYSTFWQRRMWRMMGRRALWRSRKIIGVSERALKTCEQLFGARIANRSVVIYHGISPQFRPQPKEVVAGVRERYRLPERFFLSVGSDLPHKNLGTLLQALALMEPTAAIPLVMAGFDAKKSKVAEAVEELGLGGRVRFVGGVPEHDLPGLYTAAHTLLFPSLAEGFGFPMLEAMACGTPVICSSLNVLKEITGGHARIVSAREPQEWRQAMEMAIGSLDWHDRYREKGLAWVRQFSWETAARETLEVYRSLYRVR